MNPQPVSLAGNWRVEDGWSGEKRVPFLVRDGHDGIRLDIEAAEFIKALLDQHAVAEPPIEVTRGDYWRWMSEEDNHLESLVNDCNVLIKAKDLRALAHAAEQPKLTEHVTAGFKEFSVSVDDEYDGYLSINVGTESASREQADFVEHAIKAALLTSPVAPPPQTFEKWFLLWDTTHDPEVKRLCGIAWSAGFTSRDWQPPDDAARPSQPETVGEAGRQPSNFLSSPTEQPPVAPGEPPDKRTVPPRPQAFPGPGAPYPSKTPSREQYEAAQEREGEDPFDDWFQASEWYAPGITLEFVRCAMEAWATAAKLAREEALEEISQHFPMITHVPTLAQIYSCVCGWKGQSWGEHIRALAAQPSPQKKEDAK